MEETKTQEATPEKEETKSQDNTQSALDRAERANAEKRELLEREEKLTARKEKLAALQMVGGQAEAGQVPEKPKEETPQEYAKRIVAGDIDEKKE